MTDHAKPSITVNVDIANPGQFFACCGLLELADRLWPGAEGWFDKENTSFAVSCALQATGPLPELVAKLVKAGLEGELSPSLAEERQQLEEKKRRLKKENKSLPKGEEQRRKELGTLLRSGMIRIREPFGLTLDWWQNDDESIPKTWAGSQQVVRIAQAALAETAWAFEMQEPFDFRCVMRPESSDDDKQSSSVRRQRKDRSKRKAEPFYFDSRHGANALPLDIGFSPNELGMESNAFPAVEFLCLIGLQRCRPKATDTKDIFEYFPWPKPLPISVVPIAVCGFLGQRLGYHFENAYRTDQRKHKGYLPATPFRR